MSLSVECCWVGGHQEVSIQQSWGIIWKSQLASAAFDVTRTQEAESAQSWEGAWVSGTFVLGELASGCLRHPTVIAVT